MGKVWQLRSLGSQTTTIPQEVIDWTYSADDPNTRNAPKATLCWTASVTPPDPSVQGPRPPAATGFLVLFAGLRLANGENEREIRGKEESEVGVLSLSASLLWGCGGWLCAWAEGPVPNEQPSPCRSLSLATTPRIIGLLHHPLQFLMSIHTFENSVLNKHPVNCAAWRSTFCGLLGPWYNPRAHFTDLQNTGLNPYPRAYSNPERRQGSQHHRCLADNRNWDSVWKELFKVTAKSPDGRTETHSFLSLVRCFPLCHKVVNQVRTLRTSSTKN